MKSLTWLTIVQALTASAAPALLKKKRECPVPVIGVDWIAQRAPLQEASATFGTVELTTSAPPPIISSDVVQDVSIVTTSISSGLAEILPTLSTATPDTSGSVISTIRIGENPVPSTSISDPTYTIQAVEPSFAIELPTRSLEMASGNIFVPVATNAPPSQIPVRDDHPVPRIGITKQTKPISTNKFYANFFLGTQSQPTWTHPYSVSWPRGGGTSRSWGMAITHIEASQKVFGPDPNANPPQYFINPGGIHYVAMSATELSGGTILTTDSLTAFSANVNLHQNSGASPLISFPLVQGMGFCTGIYNGGTPILQTGVFFRSLTREQNLPNGCAKYRIILEDSSTWLVYAYSPRTAPLTLNVVNNGLIQATSNFVGTLQVAKSPSAQAEAMYDASCGAYATGSTLSGNATGTVGTYTMTFKKEGLQSSSLIMWALPHHVQSFSALTQRFVRGVYLQTTTKGVATAVVADSWTLEERKMPVDMGFAPWSDVAGTVNSISPAAAEVIKPIALREISQDIYAQANLNSFYYGGKALAKFAQIVWTFNALLKDPGIAQSGLEKLKAAFELWTSNRNQFPLVYEKAWGGITSSASYITGDAGMDFGNTNYNDHHFHYGYFILAAAYIGSLDANWLATHKDYINAMVRDIANPSEADTYFPISRGFDWYHGHSWAKGLFESGDGKDQESSSEDAMFAYAIKMWGHTNKDAAMEARGNLQLSVVTRSIANYFCYTNDNRIQPPNFIANKVSGILFENKIDHTTYFGANVEYIQGIHMIPLLPSSPLTRPKQFVREEWDRYFNNGRADAVQGGWKGLLYANLALIDPRTAWNFFSRRDFDNLWIDGGASRTWYLALTGKS